MTGVAAYLAFLMTVDVPMYLSRWRPGLGDGSKLPTLLEGLEPLFPDNGGLRLKDLSVVSKMLRCAERTAAADACSAASTSGMAIRRARH